MTTAPHQQLAAVTAPAEEELQLLDAYWRTANYLAVGMIYLKDNPHRSAANHIHSADANVPAAGEEK